MVLHGFALLLLLASCGKGPKDIAGTYASYVAGEYSISKDTLVISKYDGDGDSYQVVRNSAFQKVRNGKLQAEEHKSRTFVGRYDVDSGMLDIEATGKQIHFDLEKGTLLMMQREYKKVSGIQQVGL